MVAYKIAHDVIMGDFACQLLSLSLDWRNDKYKSKRDY